MKHRIAPTLCAALVALSCGPRSEPAEPGSLSAAGTATHIATHQHAGFDSHTVWLTDGSCITLGANVPDYSPEEIAYVLGRLQQGAYARVSGRQTKQRTSCMYPTSFEFTEK